MGNFGLRFNGSKVLQEAARVHIRSVRIDAMIPSQLSIVLRKLFILVIDRFPTFILNE